METDKDRLVKEMSYSDGVCRMLSGGRPPPRLVPYLVPGLTHLIYMEDVN